MGGHYQRFDPTTIKHDRICVALGMRGSGKSTVMRAICAALASFFHIVLGVSPTYGSRDCMKQFMPACCVHSKTEVIKPIISNLIEYQQKLVDKGFTKDHVNPKKRLRKIFIMLDDCMFDTSLVKGDLMRELAMNGRWFNIFVLNAVQYSVDLPPAFRTNSDYIIAMREPDADNRKKLYKYFFGIFGDQKKFEKVFAEMTKDFGCMILDKTIPTTNPEDCVFHYRAAEHQEPYQMGSDTMWSLYDKYYLPASQQQQGTLVNEKTAKDIAAAQDTVVLTDKNGEQWTKEKEASMRKPPSMVSIKNKGVDKSKPGRAPSSTKPRKSSLTIAQEEAEQMLQKALKKRDSAPASKTRKWEDEPYESAYR